MKLPVRYQAAILRDDQLLLLKVWDHTFTNQTFWVIPGGGPLPGESEEETVKREAMEETHLEVEVGQLILDEPDLPEGLYDRTRTFACRIISGEARPGSEPEVDTWDKATITAIGWFHLRHSKTWDPSAANDPVTRGMLERLRQALGYTG
jgi:8-oxo-dGTP pyrophosphatase MutT (NUDIX family)